VPNFFFASFLLTWKVQSSSPFSSLRFDSFTAFYFFWRDPTNLPSSSLEFFLDDLSTFSLSFLFFPFVFSPALSTRSDFPPFPASRMNHLDFLFSILPRLKICLWLAFILFFHLFGAPSSFFDNSSPLIPPSPSLVEFYLGFPVSLPLLCQPSFLGCINLRFLLSFLC